MTVFGFGPTWSQIQTPCRSWTLPWAKLSPALTGIASITWFGKFEPNTCWLSPKKKQPMLVNIELSSPKVRHLKPIYIGLSMPETWIIRCQQSLTLNGSSTAMPTNQTNRMCVVLSKYFHNGFKCCRMLPLVRARIIDLVNHLNLFQHTILTKTSNRFIKEVHWYCLHPWLGRWDLIACITWRFSYRTGQDLPNISNFHVVIAIEYKGLDLLISGRFTRESLYDTSTSGFVPTRSNTMDSLQRFNPNAWFCFDMSGQVSTLSSSSTLESVPFWSASHISSDCISCACAGTLFASCILFFHLFVPFMHSLRMFNNLC